jgi:hypothetical protein
MRGFTIIVLAVAIGLCSAFSPFASGDPDGLVKVAERQHFDDRGRLAGVQQHAPAGGYAFPGVHDERLAKGLAGFGGSIAVFLLGAGVATLMRRRALGARAA